MDVGQGLEAPPAFVIVRPAAEAVPLGVGGIGAVVRAAGAVAAVPVEVDAVRAGVGEHAVQDHPNAPLPRRLAQGPEVLLRAEGRVDHAIIAGVVLVVAAGLEDGVEVDHRHAHGAYVVQLLHDAAQVAAEVVVVDAVAILVVVDTQGRVVVPVDVVVGGRGQLGYVLLAPAEIAVHHDLEHHAVSEPVRGGVGGVVDRHLIAPGLLRGDLPHSAQAIRGVAQIEGIAFDIHGDEIVPQKARRIRRGEAALEIFPHPAHALAGLGVVPP